LKHDTAPKSFTNENKQPLNVIPNNSQGQTGNFQWSYYQTIRKEWKCNNGECEEKTTKCTNSNTNCEALQNRFKADDNYQPEIPQLDLSRHQFPPPELAHFFTAATNEFQANPPAFENFGQVDIIQNAENSQFYYAEAKFFKKKCSNGVCTVTKTTCKNGKCNEETIKTVV
jgi:uncharacterized low-complexity protein